MFKIIASTGNGNLDPEWLYQREQVNNLLRDHGTEVSTILKSSATMGDNEILALLKGFEHKDLIAFQYQILIKNREAATPQWGRIVRLISKTIYNNRIEFDCFEGNSRCVVS